MLRSPEEVFRSLRSPAQSADSNQQTKPPLQSRRAHYRKQANSVRRFALTVLLTASALMTRAILRHTAMANTTVPVKEDRLILARPAGKTTSRRVQRPSARVDVRRAPSTRALFQYRRDDATPNQVTLAQIDAAKQAATPVSPNIFGNFIEHLGGVVYQALWSQLLLNPNLERIEARDTLPDAWQTSGAASWQADGYRSPMYMRLGPDTKKTASLGFLPDSRPATPVALLPAGSDAKMGTAERQRESGSLLRIGWKQSVSRPATLWQHVALPAQRTTHYNVTLVARAPLGTGKIRVTLARESEIEEKKRRKEEEERTATLSTLNSQLSTTFAVTQTQWQAFRCTLVVPKSATPEENLWRFTIAHEDGQAVDVDQVEMLPSDSMDGFDPEVVGRTKVWGVPLLRYPGGNFASGYNWQDGVGPHAQRPTRRNPAWGGVEPNHVGTNEFMTFARLVGATPQLTVNAGDGTPQEAAEWVRYCNAPASGDKWGRMRAANGATKPFDVKIWEVGNELYGGWQIGHAQAQDNANRFVKFRDAMLAADPTLRLIATGKGDEFTPAGQKRDDAWNDALLQAAARDGGRTPDWISLHPLVPLPDYARGATYDEQLESAFAHPAYLDNTLIPDVISHIEAVEGKNARTRIAITEWGIIVGGREWESGPNHDTLSGAIYNALALNAMLRNSDWVTLANMTALLHGGGIKKWEGIVYVDPQYYTQQMYTLAHPHAPIATTTTGPGHDVPARGQMPAVKDVPDVDVFAARTQNHRKLVVFAVNRHRSASRPLRLQVDHFQTQRVSATLLTADKPQARNTLESPNVVEPRPMEVPAWPSDPGTDWQISIPPHSLVVLTLEGK